jgi:circadian clock protein KaiC
MEKVKFGIKGLDAMLYGGIPLGSQVILGGGPGTGKTLLSFEFLYNNAKLGNNCVFFAFDEEPERVITDFKLAFPKLSDIDQLLIEKKISIVGDETTAGISAAGDQSDYQFGKLVSEIEYITTSAKANRIVIDSISLLKIMINNELSYRKAMIALLSNLRRLGLTSIMTADLHSLEQSNLHFTPEYFIFDGIITMYQKGLDSKRLLTMEVIKMRGSKHSFEAAPYEIIDDGINVLSAQEIM